MLTSSLSDAAGGGCCFAQAEFLFGSSSFSNKSTCALLKAVNVSRVEIVHHPPSFGFVDNTVQTSDIELISAPLIVSTSKPDLIDPSKAAKEPGMTPATTTLGFMRFSGRVYLMRPATFSGSRTETILRESSMSTTPAKISNLGISRIGS